MASALVLVNRNSGTVRSRGADAVDDLVREQLSSVFDPFDVRLFEGDITPTIEGDENRHDIIIAGGGDGTIASAADALLKTGQILGALPLGTMNLFVQALGFSSKLEEALEQIKAATVYPIDVGTANDRIFLHQVSFGLQPRMGRLREKLGYKSRAGKIASTARALIALSMRPKLVRGRVQLDDEEFLVSSPMVAVTNNPIGSRSYWSVQHRLDTGQLGYYALSEFSLRALLGLARDYMKNRLHDADIVDHRIANAVTLKRLSRSLRFSRRKGVLASLDGEIIVLDNPVSVGMKRRALKVLGLGAPSQTEEAAPSGS